MIYYLYKISHYNKTRYTQRIFDENIRLQYKPTQLMESYFMVPRSSGFISATAVTFAAFASGMGMCLFNLDTVGACVEVANVWVVKFQQIGNHLVAWGVAILKSVRH